MTRAYSNWKQEYYHRREILSFSEAIRTGRRRVSGEGSIEGLHRLFTYVERDLCAEQPGYLSTYFSRTNIHCEIYEEFSQNRSAALDRIARFLSIQQFPAAIPDLYLNVSK